MIQKIYLTLVVYEVLYEGVTIFPRIIARGDNFFFTQKGWQLFEGGDYFKWFSLEVVPMEVFCFIVTWNQKTITSNKLNMGFLIVPNLVPWLIFRADSSLISFAVSHSISIMTGRGGDKRKRRWCDGWGRGWLLKGGDRLGLGLGVRVPHNQQNILKHLTNET